MTSGHRPRLFYVNNFDRAVLRQPGVYLDLEFLESSDRQIVAISVFRTILAPLVIVEQQVFQEFPPVSDRKTLDCAFLLTWTIVLPEQLDVHSEFPSAPTSGSHRTKFTEPAV